MSHEPERRETEPERVTRVIDFRIPLPWLIGVCAGIGWALISMYFSVNSLVKTVGDLQVDVKAGNGSVTAIAGKQALIEFRMDNTDAALKRAEASIVVLQQRGK